MNNGHSWYKDAILYELHVRAFADGGPEPDGAGDFRGLAKKLDYLQDLGVTALWILPFYPSPLKDDGYDIADYMDVHPDYGTLADFKYFLKQAHRRGLRVITELVLNHTSDKHAWFQRARRSPPGSVYRDFYVWSDSPERYKGTRIIFKDFETSNWTLDPVAKAYYWHRFYSHQPDLNYNNPEVEKAIYRVVDFWLGMGVDGMRLDAVPYLYEREGTSCENLPETHAFLKRLRAHIDAKYSDRVLLAEANQWPEEASTYFGSGDECHMAFHFPIMPRLFMALHMEDRFPIIDILQQTPQIHENAQWAMFLRNHDELTLEMVTDEERDYMYRYYALDPKARINLGIRRRLAPLLRNHRRKMELMNGLLFSLLGTPVLYYGDEIGMGDNIYLGDRNGVRTPMQWNSDKNAGFSRANPQRLYLPIIIDPEYHYETVNVEAQQNNPHSLLWWMKRLIALRKRFKAFGRGTIEFLHPSNRKVLVFLRRYEKELILVIANLSRFVESVELDLSAFKGMIPRELFSRSTFPSIGDLPYFITLGPTEFYMFALEPKKELPAAAPENRQNLPSLETEEEWTEIFKGRTRSELEEILAAYVPSCRWFGGKANTLNGAKITGTLFMIYGNSKAAISLVRFDYANAQPEVYMIPLTYAAGDRAREFAHSRRSFVVAEITVKSREGEEKGVLYDPLFEKDFQSALLLGIVRRRHIKGGGGEMVAGQTRKLREMFSAKEGGAYEPSLVSSEQSNTSIIYGKRMILKLFRRLEEGVNPDLEVGRFLTEKTDFKQTPPIGGFLDYVKGSVHMTAGILQSYIPNQGNAWQYTVDEIGPFFERALAAHIPVKEIVQPSGDPAMPQPQDAPAQAREMISSYLESARLLGKRTAEMHCALASSPDHPDFSPEPFLYHDQRSLYQSMRNVVNRVLQLLRKNISTLGETARQDALKVLEREPKILKFFRTILDQKFTSLRIRCHGDYHLGQVLYTGKDFIIIDFEGEPHRPLSERRIKRSPLRDVAGMLCSFKYAVRTGIHEQTTRGVIGPEKAAEAEEWAKFWQGWVSAVFLKAYQGGTCPVTGFVQSGGEFDFLLKLFMMEKVINELGYELNNRPDWVKIPLKSILEISENFGG